MKVYLVGDNGPEHDSLIAIYLDKSKALKAFQRHRSELLKHIKEMLEFSKKEGGYGDEMYLKMISNLSETDPDKIDNYPHDTPYLKKMEVIK